MSSTAINPDHYTFRVTWSEQDEEFVGTCVEFPSLSWLNATPEAALAGLRELVADVVADMTESGKTIASHRRTAR